MENADADKDGTISADEIANALGTSAESFSDFS
jgi:hypothetical protein